jgi:hypothetical protein
LIKEFWPKEIIYKDLVVSKPIFFEDVLIVQKV